MTVQEVIVKLTSRDEWKKEKKAKKKGNKKKEKEGKRGKKRGFHLTRYDLLCSFLLFLLLLSFSTYRKSYYPTFSFTSFFFVFKKYTAKGYHFIVQLYVYSSKWYSTMWNNMVML